MMKWHNAIWLIVALCFMVTCKNSFGRTVGLDRFKNGNNIPRDIFYAVDVDDTGESKDPTTEETKDPVDTTVEPKDPTTEKPKDPTTDKPKDPTTEKPKDPTTEKPKDPDSCGEITCKGNQECIKGICKCKTGFAVRETEDVCEDCNCDENNLKECIWEDGKDSATCVCDVGYAIKDGKCAACDCGDNSDKCSWEDGAVKPICTCKSGFSQKGETCETCDCGVNSDKCSWEDGIPICICKTGFSQNGKKCENCNCDENNLKECIWEDGKDNATCVCDVGFAIKDGKCAVCDCGENSDKCSWEDGAEEPSCTCKTRYSQRNGKCEACDCGENSYKCSWKDGVTKPICTCKAGFSQKDGKCETCNCGENSNKCRWEDGAIKPTCTCNTGFSQKEGKCEVCNCGENSEKCIWKDGAKEPTCTCKTGFSQKGKKCEKCDCGKNSNDCIWMDDEDFPICNCKTGYGQKEESCEECSLTCDNGKCGFEGDAEICKCNNGYFHFSNDTITSSCHDCECGDHKERCIWKEDVGVICECGKNYAQKGTRCEKCNFDCGTDGICEFYNETHETCECNPGFAFVKNTCKNENPCRDDSCDSNHGRCTVTEDLNTKCICDEGYGNTICNLISWCMDNKECKNCTFNPDLKTGFCICPETDEYFDISKKKCIKIDKCAGVTCRANQKCEDGECNCIGNYNKIKEECVWNKTNCANFCGTDSDCETNPQNPNSAICICGKGSYFNGKKCQNVVCKLQYFNGCSQDCTITDGEAVCSCRNGFKLANDKKTCEPTDEKKKCDNDKQKCNIGDCIKVNDKKFLCMCPSGYKQTKSKDKCEFDIQLCLGQQWDEDSKKCKCAGKFKQAANGVTCEKRSMCEDKDIIKECAEKNAHCVDTDDGYDCTCADGFKKDPSNDNKCTDLCEFKEAIKICSQQNKECYMKLGDDGKLVPACKCPATFIDDATCTKLAPYSYIMESLPIDGKSFSNDVNNAKLQKEIDAAMRVLFPKLLSITVLECKKNDSVILCSSELQFKEELKEDEKKLLHVPSSCLDRKGSEDGFCILAPSLPLKRDRINDVSIDVTKRCSPVVKTELCGKYAECTENTTLNTFRCSCGKGYINLQKKVAGDSFIVLCEDDDECETGYSCGDHTECENTIGDYHCKCKDGYIKPKGKASIKNNKDGCIDICHEGACGYGACKVTDNFQKDCSCKAGYGGSYCNRADINYKEARKSTVVVAAVLGTLLGVAIIVFFIAVRKLRKHKYSQDFTPSNARLADGAEMTERRQLRQGVSNRAYQ